MFDHKLKLFLADLDREILATPTGPAREALTDAHIALLQLEDSRKLSSDLERVTEAREKDEQPFREKAYPEGPVSMGHGRKLEPEVLDGVLVSGTVFEGCPASPDGYHHFTAVSNIQSVEHFRCDYCPKGFYD
jgi:hypothetical protein